LKKNQRDSGKNDTPSTHIHDRSLSGLRACTFDIVNSSLLPCY
jgi:hypothetical protein